MTTHTLKKYIANLPSGPGIYLFSARGGGGSASGGKKILYIGKATNLKSRVSFYLKTEDMKIKNMVESAKLLKFISTESEIEALILESQLIKSFRPQFNIVMRDDKQYFYVGFTDDIFPKLFITHQIENWKLEIGNYFIGPFTDGNILKSTLQFLRRIFPYCTCRQLHNNFCLNYHIGKCFGYCCLKKQRWITDFASRLSTGLFNSTTYKKNITSIKMVLSGKNKSVIKNLEKEMIRSAKNGDLEKAIELREKLGKLKRVFENAKIIRNKSHNCMIYHTIKEGQVLKSLQKVFKLPAPPFRIEGYDVSNIQGTHATGSMVTFIHGRPDNNYYRKFKIKNLKLKVTGGNDTAMLKEILQRRFKHDEWPFPNLIVIDGGKGQVNSTIKTLKELSIKIPVIGISKNERHMGHQLIIPGRKAPLALTKLSPTDRNLLLAVDSEAHRFAIIYYRKIHRRKLTPKFTP